MNRHLYHDKNGRLIAAICINGKQKLKRVKDKAQAQQWFLAMETGNTKASQLTYAQMSDAATAIDLLSQHGMTMTLTDIATQFLKNRPTGRTMTLHDAIREYEDRSQARVAPKTLYGYLWMLRPGEYAADGSLANRSATGRAWLVYTVLCHHLSHMVN